MFDELLENIYLLDIHYQCSECGTEVTLPFIESSFYQNVKANEDMLLDFVEAYLSFDDLDKLPENRVTIHAPSSLCNNKDCKRAKLKKIKEEQLKLIKVPAMFKDTPPCSSTEDEFEGKLGVLYYGKVGSGKTYKSIALLKRYILSNGGINSCTYKFINMCDLFFKVQEEMRIKNSERKSIIKQCIDADILVLDDLGTEKNSEWSEAQIYLILNSRIENLKPTIVSTNMIKKVPYEELFNDRIASRLYLFNAKPVTGGDKRKNAN